MPYLEPLNDRDTQDALLAASPVSDDHIQKAATRHTTPEWWTHDYSAQRQKWFTVGYQSDDPKKCDTFDAKNFGIAATYTLANRSGWEERSTHKVCYAAQLL